MVMSVYTQHVRPRGWSSELILSLWWDQARTDLTTRVWEFRMTHSRDRDRVTS